MDTSVIIYGKWIIPIILSLLVERVLIHHGVICGKTVWLVAWNLLIAILVQVLGPDGKFWIFCPFMIILGPISINRDDFVMTIRKGKWWWKAGGTG